MIVAVTLLAHVPPDEAKALSQMRMINMLFFRLVLTAVLSFLMTSAATAQEIPDWIASLSTKDSSHPGLLGKQYVEGRYLYLDIDDLPSELGDHIEGLRSSINTPLFSFDEKLISVDGFASFQYLSLSSSFTYPVDDPPSIQSADVRMSQSILSVGASLYTEPEPGVRPFLQVGVRQRMERIRFSLPDFGRFVARENDTLLLLIPGIEVDVIKDLAVRASVDIETREEFDDSEAAAELIYWPGQQIFMRAGALTFLNGTSQGFFAGLGYAY